MSCHRILGGIVCIADRYHFEGFTFEWHHYLGPTRLRKDGEPAKRQGNKFYAAAQRWFNLPKKQREKFRVNS